jgi:hypothetical protein
MIVLLIQTFNYSLQKIKAKYKHKVQSFIRKSKKLHFCYFN